MPSFVWKGRNSNGQLVEGRVESLTSSAVADLLLGQGITPVSIQEGAATHSQSPPSGRRISLFKPRITDLDVTPPSLEDIYSHFSRRTGQ